MAPTTVPELISVVIPCYNSRRYITATIQSVLAQEDVNFELIVVDDGSDDGGAELVESLFPDVKLFRTANQGPSAARNYGTGKSTGEFIQYLDADDLLASGKLQNQLAALRQSKADVAYGDWHKFDVLSDGTKIIRERFDRQLGSSPEIDLFTAFWCPTAAYLIRRQTVDRVGGWHPNLPIIQDARFMLDCALVGAQFLYCRGLMAEYRVHQSGSVSTRSRNAFLADCLRNALEVRDLWIAYGKWDAPHQQAVIAVLDMVANGSLAAGDRPIFEQACSAIDTRRGFVPSDWAWKKRAAIGVLGYRNAIAAAHYLRGGTIGSLGAVAAQKCVSPK